MENHAFLMAYIGEEYYMIKELNSLTTKQIDAVYKSLQLTTQEKMNIIQNHLGDKIEISSVALVFNDVKHITEYYKIDKGDTIDSVKNFGMPDKSISEFEFHRHLVSGDDVKIYRYVNFSFLLIEENVPVIINSWWQDLVCEYLEQLAGVTRSDAQGIYEAFDIQATDSEKSALKSKNPLSAARDLFYS